MFKINYIILILALIFSNNVFSQEKVFFDSLPVPIGVKSSVDPSVPQIEWNRWTTRNFVIHSIDLQQGQYLTDNIEQMKMWVLERWGLEDSDFSAEVSIWCVPDKSTMKKMFNFEDSRGEVIEENGKIKVSNLWIVLDMKPAETIPAALTVVALKEYENKHKVKFGWWVHRGLPVLNMTLAQIKNKLATLEKPLQNDSGMFFSKSLFSTKPQDLNNQTSEIRNLFDAQAAMMCLLVRKEFGQNNFLIFIQDSNLQKLGFRDNGEIDSVFKRYMFYLIQDIKQNKTPDSYLQIIKVEK